MRPEELKDLVVRALEDLKAVDVRVIDVRGKTSITDLMVVAGGTSDRHVRALADNVVEEAKRAGVQPLGVEGAQSGDWMLIDLVDVVVHVMLPEVRAFYALERLWGMDETAQAGAR